MQKPHLIKRMRREAAVFLFCILFECIYTQDSFVISGNFQTAFIENSTLQNVAGLITYNPTTDSFSNQYRGGVYSNEESALLMLASTPLGIYAEGTFTHVGEPFVYSSMVAQYDTTHNQLIGLNSGIYPGMTQSGSVSLISYVNDYVVFGGSFTQVPSMSATQFINGEPDIKVPNLVRMNSQTKVYSLLEDPRNVLDCEMGVEGLASTGDTLFVQCYGSTEHIFSWDASNYFKLIVPNASGISKGTLNVDRLGNFYAISNNQPPTGGIAFNLSYFNTSNANKETVFPLVTYPYFGGSTPVFTLPNWNEGILLAYTVNQITTFKYFNSSSGVLQDTFVPSGNFTVDSLVYFQYVSPMVAGASNDIWLFAMTSESTMLKLFYFSESTPSVWHEVSLAPVYHYQISALVWDPPNQHLLIYLHDYTVVTYLAMEKMLRVNTDVFPPSGTVLLNFVPTSKAGSVAGTTTVEQETGSELYVGGKFQRVGDGTVAFNLAKVSNGNWETVSEVLVEHEITAITSFQSTVYYATYYRQPEGMKLSIQVFDTFGNNVSFAYVPHTLNYEPIINSIFVDESYVVVGGAFTVLLKEKSIASGVVVYDKNEGTWFGIGIPINSIIEQVSSYNYQGHSYLLVVGQFNFSVGADIYNAIAFYDLQEKSLISIPAFSHCNYMTSASVNATGSVFSTGPLNKYGSVASYQLGLSSSLEYLANFGTYTLQSLWYNDALYVAGYLNATSFPNGPYAVGLTYLPMEPEPQPQPWQIAGKQSVLFEYFTGPFSEIKL